MASLRDIKKRIKSVRGSQKITRAMKLVAASKLRRAQQAIAAARPYAEEVAALVARVAASAADGQNEERVVHPLFVQRPVKKTLLVVITGDRGSCGAFNSNVIRRVTRFLHEHKGRTGQFEMLCLGRKGYEAFYKRTDIKVRNVANLVTAPNFAHTQRLADEIIASFVAGDTDEAFVFFNEAQSAMVQHVRMRDILPVAPQSASAQDNASDYIYSPDRTTLLQKLVPMLIAVSLQRALLESIAAEHGARMTAMDAATKNAEQMAETLTLQYNRARQAAITLELMDIVGGAEALAG